MRIVRKLFAFGLCVFVCGIAYAEPTATDLKTPSSKAYVDTEVGTRQPKIPRTGTNSGTPGVSVVTYTTTGNGTIGERQIYDGGTAYTNDDANKLVTASALKGSVSNLPTLTTSKLTCANSPECTLWTVQDQQVYGNESNNNSNSNNTNSSD